ncbi:MAG TPA: hypothetical protein VN669_17475 [Candidatus Acidoferrales bacterium]|jgi:hypothetical protein|nr:hypothetical protein [Candidatus Acidoferrales bacterium]
MLSKTRLRAFLFICAATFPLGLSAQMRHPAAPHVKHTGRVAAQISQATPGQQGQHGESAAEPETPPLPKDATQFVREVIRHELDAEEHDHSHWRYRAHREDEKSNSDRDIIETKEGEMARTLLIYGRPLTADERQKDQARMQKLASDPDEQAKRVKREKDDSEKAQQMFKAIPDAFIFKYDGLENGLVRLAFFPNPNYDPPTRELRVFRALSGKMWIDPVKQHVFRISGQLFQDVTFGWGLLARLNKGGTFVVNMREVGPGHWDMVSLDVNMSGHAILFKNIAVKEHQTQSEFRRVPDDLTLAQAYQILEKDAPVSANNQPAKAMPH